MRHHYICDSKDKKRLQTTYPTRRSAMSAARKLNESQPGRYFYGNLINRSRIGVTIPTAPPWA